MRVSRECVGENAASSATCPADAHHANGTCGPGTSSTPQLRARSMNGSTPAERRGRVRPADVESSVTFSRIARDVFSSTGVTSGGSGGPRARDEEDDRNLRTLEGTLK